MMSYEEILGRALISAGGLTATSRFRTRTYDTFRGGGPRVFEGPAQKEPDDSIENMRSIYQALPPRIDSALQLGDQGASGSNTFGGQGMNDDGT